ncbi:MAG: hypothetical protein AABZ64_11770 [Nitrospinota bacterium]
MIKTLRLALGRLALLGGGGLLVYQVVLWLRSGVWRHFPLAIGVEAVVQFIGGLLAVLPMMTPEGVALFQLFQASDLPWFLPRLLRVIPMSGFFLVAGYFCVKWEKYVG